MCRCNTDQTAERTAAERADAMKSSTMIDGLPASEKANVLRGLAEQLRDAGSDMDLANAFELRAAGYARSAILDEPPSGYVLRAADSGEALEAMRERRAYVQAFALN